MYAGVITAEHHLEMSQLSRDKHVLLIELVKNNPAIYNPNCKLYTNRDYKLKCWEKISLKVGVTVAVCKKRWKSLRDQYFKKQRDVKNGSQPAALNNWLLGQMMAFLSDKTLLSKQQHDQSPQISTLQPDSDTEDSLHEKLDPLEDQSSEPNETECGEEGEITNWSSVKRSGESMDEDEDEDENYHRSREKRKREYPVDGEFGDGGRVKRKMDYGTFLSILSKIETQRALMLQKLVENARARTPMKMFFDSMAVVVENFPKSAQADIRQKICDLITETQITIENKSVDASSSND